MVDSADTVDAAEDLLHQAEVRALAILNDTGFGQFIGRFESDEAWNTLNAASRASDDPLSLGMRASRASTCLLLVELIRSAYAAQVTKRGRGQRASHANAARLG